MVVDRSPGPSGPPSSVDTPKWMETTTSVAAPGADIAANTATASHGHRMVVVAVVRVSRGGLLAAAHVDGEEEADLFLALSFAEGLARAGDLFACRSRLASSRIWLAILP